MLRPDPASLTKALRGVTLASSLALSLALPLLGGVWLGQRLGGGGLEVLTGILGLLVGATLCYGIVKSAIKDL
jgi:hypothetical protein